MCGDRRKSLECFAFLALAKKFVGLPYKWGGDDPMGGFDCSGLVIECLKAAGHLEEREDLTADGLWTRFNPSYKGKYPRTGALAFWFDRMGKATHVAICIDEVTCITANGGGSTTLTNEDAINQNAFITYRPVDHRKSEPRFVYLWD